MTTSEDEFRSSAGWADDEEAYLWRHPVYAELMGNESWVGLAYLSIVRKRLEPARARLLDVAACAMTQPDPRVPPLKLARMIAARGDAAIGLSTGAIACVGARIGPWAVGGCARFLWELSRQQGELSARLETHLERGPVPGFGIPFREEDVRVPHVRRWVDELEHGGPFWKLQAELEALMEARGGPVPNVALPVAALFLDLGVPAANAALLALALMMPNFLANVVDASEEPHPAYLALPESKVRYVGVGPRRSPQAEADRRSKSSDEAC